MDKLSLNYDYCEDDLENMDYLNVKNTQKYNPIYTKYFKLTENNYNKITLNQQHKLLGVLEKKTFSTYLCKIGHKNNFQKKEIFVKFAPLIDPIKYMIGKYDFDNDSLFTLPQLNENTVVSKTKKKLEDYNNCAYVDGFFSFLTSKLLHEYKFLNSVDFYGSYLANHNNMKINIYDDIDFLNDSEDFHKSKNVHFEIDDDFYDELSNYDSNNNKKKINISGGEVEPLNIEELADSSLENSKEIDINKSFVNLSELNDLSLNFLDISSNINKKDSRCSSLTCSSRSSHTESDTDNEDEDKNDSEGDEDDESDESDESDEDEEREICAYIKNFPVNVIMLEKCDQTLDSYMLKNELEETEWECILLQIIFTLITYQKVFDFTHNDLHTNNIMFTSTEKQFLHYTYNGKTYKIPTFGKMWKIIDFGRSIFTFSGNLITSDSFSSKGDAATQYNFGPYYNDKKPKVEPNKSFDLCRLGCSLFDYFIDNIKDIKDRRDCDNLQCLILEWCEDDKNKNVLYKNNGEERYPEFKLYKMISRTVHNHTPQRQLERVMFDKYRVSKKKLNKKTKIINIDAIPCCV